MLYFFDIDGTLSAPRYDDHGKMVVGFYDEDWQDFCMNHTEDAYDHCAIVQPIYDYAKKMADEGHMVCILSTICDYYEMLAKHSFLQKKGLVSGSSYWRSTFVTGYFNRSPNSFFKVDFYVRHDQDKVPAILEIAKRLERGPSDCAIVDDSFSIVLEAHCNGIKGIHPSNILTNTVSG